jgi:LacI family gluconate utilization system Gnt-I transcriptional repressor
VSDRRAGKKAKQARQGSQKRDAARPPTIRQLAQAAGLSLSTVARAFSDAQLVRPETRTLIHEAAERIGYIPNLAARALQTRRSRVVALVIPALNNSLWAEAAQGVCDVLRAQDYHLLVGSVLDQRRTRDTEEEVVRTLLGRRPDGIVLTALGHSAAARRLLKRSGVPTIEIGDLPDQPIDLAVGPSNYQAARELTLALAQRGYKSIGFMCGSYVDNELIDHRRAGYLSAIKELARGDAGDLIIECEVPVTLERAGTATAAILARRPEIDALICSGDYFAHGALLWCLRHQVAVPQRVAIAGMGDLELSGQLTPSLSTVHFDGYEIGRRAARKLLARLDDRSDGAPVEDTGFRIVLREST